MSDECEICGSPTCEGTHMVGQPKRGTILDAQGRVPSPTSGESERRFPIQRCGSIPWEAAEPAYRAYARRFGTDHSLEQLAERGGFYLQEWACLYTDCPRFMSDHDRPTCIWKALTEAGLLHV